jgi:hypothetical protein
MIDWDRTADIWSNWGTAGGLLVGAFTAWFALLSYRGQLRMQADSHAHELIRDLLHVNMDQDIGLGSEAETFRLYTLEELVDWVREQQREVERWGWLQGAAERRRRADELRGWDETIKTHLEWNMRQRVEECMACYGKDFAEFVLAHAPTSAREGGTARERPPAP